MKKWAFVFAVSLLLSVFAGCAGQPPANPAVQSDYPLETDVTLKVWTSGYVDGLNDSEMVRAYQEKTGVKVQFVGDWFTGQSMNLRVMCESDLAPDILFCNLNDLAEDMGYASYGDYFVDIKGDLGLYSPAYLAWTENRPHRTVSRLYYYLKASALDSPRSSGGLVIRKDLLDRLGLPEPETIAQWENTLTQFRALEPRIVPLLVSMEDLKGLFGTAYYMYPGWYIQDGHVAYGYTNPACRQFFTDMNRWYANGLLDQNFINISDDNLWQRVTDGLAAASAVDNADQMEEWIYHADMKNGAAWELVGVRPPVLAAGEHPRRVLDAPGETQYGALITTRSRHQELAAKMLDWNYTQEGSTFLNFGLDPVEYPESQLYSRARYFNYGNGQVLPFVVDNWPSSQQPLYHYTEQYDAVLSWNAGGPTLFRLPVALITNVEQDRIQQLRREIEAYVREMEIRFIIGDVPLSEYDAFAAQLQAMGVEQVQEYLDTAYQRYVAEEGNMP